MKIFIPPGSPMDGAVYLAEILNAFGLCFAERLPLREVLKAADPRADVILLPVGSESAGIESFLQAGGGVFAIRPGEYIERMAEVRHVREDDTPSRLRLTQPVCHGARGESLWTLGTVNVFEGAPGPHIAGYLFRPNDPKSQSIGILERATGKGRLMVYAYDPVVCISRLRQGYPERANHLPAGQRTPRATFLHDPNPPVDTFWRPTADLHAALLCNLIQRLLGRHAPVPALWHLPGGAPAILLFSGDEDVGAQEANHQQMSDLESFGGSMNLYVIPDQTSITRELIEGYTRRGHAISVHPNLVPAAGKSPAEQLARAEQQVRLFRENFQWPARTVRNHSYVWPGYLELPDLWERLGIGMDANTTATLYGRSPDGGPFVNVNSAIPLPFVREDGSLVRVYQQPTHINDDLAAHPTTDHSHKYSPEEFDWIAQRLFDEAVRFFHAPICVNVHPCNYVSFSGPHGRALMSRAKEFGLPIWSLDRWHDFWRARASWRMDGLAWDGSRLTFTLKGAACESLWLALPMAANERALRSLKLGGVPNGFEKVRRHGCLVAQAPLPARTTEIEVAAEFGAT
ncbi:MAG: hypothetical protein HY360_25965 [Verrucomicrobia bacterium]|nr:hypothetical protein [Verrucomicrobiota bacterium]